MRIGPFHVFRHATVRKLRLLDDLLAEVHRALAAAANPAALARDVVEHAHGFLHSPLSVPALVPALPIEDAVPTSEDREAAARVIAAYARSRKGQSRRPGPSIWDRIRDGQKEFLGAVAAADITAVSTSLSRMFTSNLVQGLGQVHTSHVSLLKSGEVTHVHLRFADTLLSLAEALGAAAVTSAEQDSASHLRALQRDPESLYRGVVERLGFHPSSPEHGCAYGFRIGGHLVSMDSLTHAYTAARLRQLGSGEGLTIFEIGGGYGCLALMARRAGIRKFTIYDLPWVNALQGYFLIRALPHGVVSLYGEQPADVRVLPYWVLSSEAAGSCDGVVNTDSMPEMARHTAAEYLVDIRRVARTFFLSINQEAKSEVPGFGEQQSVSELIERGGGFERLSRHRAWMRQGYVEEVFRPNP